MIWECSRAPIGLLTGLRGGNAMLHGPAWNRLIARGTQHAVVIRNLSWDVPVSPWHQLLHPWRAGEGSLTGPRGTSGPRRGGHSCPSMPSAWCFPTPSCGFSLRSGHSRWPWVPDSLPSPRESPQPAPCQSEPGTAAPQHVKRPRFSQIKFPTVEELMSHSWL